MAAGKNNFSEQHPNFPSGDWEGFYLYAAGPSAKRHQMAFKLNFSDGVVTGSGSDEVGTFSWNGEYDTTSMVVRMVKKYPSHPVFYDGRADTNGIYGTWSLELFGRGGFHIWPKKGEETAEEVAIEKKKLSLSK